MSDDLDQRYMASVHEAGHAGAAHALGRPIRLVSIRPTRGTLGFCQQVGEPVREGDLRFETPVILQPARLRRAVETRIVVLLAGPAAVEFAAPPAPPGYVGRHPDEEQAERAARFLSSALRPKETMALALVEAEIDSTPRDEDAASALSYALAADEAAYHLEWLRRVARSLVVSDRVQHLIAALVPELLEHEVLPGRRVQAIFKEADACRDRQAA